MSDVIRVEGIGEVYGSKLKSVGVGTVDLLLERGASREGRKALAESSGISESLILRWVNHVDLFRIKGVEAQYAELLEAAGVDSVPELRSGTRRICTPSLSRSTRRGTWSGISRPRSRLPNGSSRPGRFPAWSRIELGKRFTFLGFRDLKVFYPWPGVADPTINSDAGRVDLS